MPLRHTVSILENNHMTQKPLSLIVATDEKGGIGKKGVLPWHLPSDLKRFKALTLGHAIIMGRKTHESIGRALPGRLNIVITRQKDYRPLENVIVAHSFDEALLQAGGDSEPFVIGGAEIFREALSRGLVHKIYLTTLQGDFGADTFFPSINRTQWKVLETEEHKENISDQETNVRFEVLVSPQGVGP